tara:strand:- start:1244 stop:1675 length:432 start_codon:yes stop_codon:yes gene_type:complete
MSWQNIIKAPTSNRDTRSYSGTRKYSYIDDDMMEKIVKDLNLPEMDKDGEKINYEEEDDFHLLPSLELVGEKYYGEYKLVIKFEGEIKVWAEGADDPSHIFTVDDIEFESSTIEAITERNFTLDYEYSDYNDGKIWIDVSVGK